MAGFSGGSLSTDEEEAVIRQANAHAWVEAWVGEDDTWTVFDPTPEADVPGLSRPSGRDRIRWAVDWVQSSWDRYVLTFGFGEQVQLVTAMANAVDALLGLVSWGYLPLIAVVLLLPAIQILMEPLEYSVIKKRNFQCQKIWTDYTAITNPR